MSAAKVDAAIIGGYECELCEAKPTQPCVYMRSSKSARQKPGTPTLIPHHVRRKAYYRERYAEYLALMKRPTRA